MAISDGYKHNFNTLIQAAKNDDLALLKTYDKITGKPVYAICAVQRETNGATMIPLAKLFDGNPYDELDPPVVDNDNNDND